MTDWRTFRDKPAPKGARTEPLIGLLLTMPGQSTVQYAERLGIDKTDMGVMLRRLERRGLVRGERLAGRAARGGQNLKSWHPTQLLRDTHNTDGKRTDTVRAQVLAIVGAGETLTSEQMAARLGKHVESVRSICHQLAYAGKLGRRKTPDGYVWVPRTGDLEPDGWRPGTWIHPIRARALGIRAA